MTSYLGTHTPNGEDALCEYCTWCSEAADLVIVIDNRWTGQACCLDHLDEALQVIGP